MRKNYIDILKGISILAIMLLHFEHGIFPHWLNIWLGGFMIIAFYFTSGWLTFSKREVCFKEFINKKWRGLGIPYCWFSLIYILFYIIMILCGEMEWKILLRDIYKTFTLRGIGTLWFLPALFFGDIIFFYFRKTSGVKRLIMIFATLFYFGIYDYWSANYGHLNETYRLIDAPFRTCQNISHAFFVIFLGYYSAMFYQSSLKHLNMWQTNGIAAILLLWYSFALNFQVLNSISIINFAFGPAGLLLLCMFLEKFRIFNILAYFGKNSLIVMVTHYTVLQELCVVINRRLTGETTLQGYNSLIYFAIVLLLQFPLIWFLNNKAKFLLGKKA